MSAVCFKTRNSSKNQLWTQIFGSLGTESKSCLFMKQLTTTCVSSILYFRKILPENYFESKNYEGVTIRLLKSDKGLECVDKIQNWLNGAFEAIENKYLRHFMLDIKDPESKMTLEIYTMTFSYQKGNEAMSLSKNNSNKENFSEFTINNTQIKTIKLLQMCYAVTESCSALPPKITLAVRLSYYENTPHSYQPEGYISWEPTDPQFLKETRSIEIGVTGTKYHLFKLVNKSCLNENFFKDMKSKNVLQVSEGTKKKEIKDQDETPKAKRELFFNELNKNTKAKGPQSQENIFSSQIFNFSVNNEPTDTQQSTDILDTMKILPWSQESSNSMYENSTVEDCGGDKVRCACMSEEKSQVMLTCLYCKSLVHAECFGLLEINLSKKIRFYCHICHQEGGKYKCPDKVLTNLKHSSDKQKLALLRRILKHCYKPTITTVTLKKLQNIAGPTCPKPVVEIVLKKMIEIGVALPQHRRKSYTVNKLQLHNQSPHYFYQQLGSDSSKVNSTQQEVSKRRNTESDDFFTNKSRKSTVPPVIFGTQVNTQTSSQQSHDIFNK